MSSFLYITDGKTKNGPVTLQQLTDLAKTGKLKPVDMVRQEGLSKWQPAGEIAGLFAAAPADAWHYTPDGKTKHGPLTLQALKDLARKGSLRPSDMVRQEGGAKWQLAREIPGLKSF